MTNTKHLRYVKPLSYEEQYTYYMALCEVASSTAIDWRDYRKQITEIRAELKKDPDYSLLVKNKFEAPPSDRTTNGQKALEKLVENLGR